MKIHVVKDQSGKVIASFERAIGDGPSLEPVLPEGHSIEEMEVPHNYQENLKAIYSGK